MLAEAGLSGFPVVATVPPGLLWSVRRQRGAMLKIVLDMPGTWSPSRPRGALPEAFESGAASALGEAGSPVEEVSGVRDGGRGSRERLSVDAAPSPSSQGGVSGFSASRSPARMGAPPGILAAASPVPVKNPGPCERT